MKHMRPILRLITGAAGTGKTSRCIDFFRERILLSDGSGLNSSSYFILPNKEHTDRIHDLLTRDSRISGLVQHHLLPLGDFMRFKTWTGRQRVVTQFERRWLVRRALDSRPWNWMARSAPTAGMAECMANWIRELKSAGITTEAFARMAGRLETAGHHPDKMRDLTAFYQAYEAVKQAEGFKDPEEAVEAYFRESRESSAGAENRDGAPAEMDLVVLDGFFSLTHQQTLFLEAVTQRAKEVVVTLTLPEDVSLTADVRRLEPESREEAFVYLLKLRQRLLGMGFVEERLPGPAHRFKSAGLSELERGLFRPAVKKSGETSEKPAGIRRIEAASRRQEVEAIARSMVRNVRGGRCHWSDQMAVFRGVLAYQPYIEEVFGALGVPYELHERRRLSEHPAVRRMVEWLDLFETAESDENAESPADAAVVRAEAQVLRVHRWAMWMDAPGVLRELDAQPARLAWSLIPEKLADLAPEDEAVWDRERDRVRRFLALDNARDLKEFLERLFADCAGKRELAATRRMNDMVRELVERQTLRPIEGREGVRAAVGRLGGDLRAGLYSMSVRQKNRVQIYDTALALPKEYRIVYVGGLNHGEFPVLHREHPVLSDAERKATASEEAALDTAEDRRRGEAYFFYMAVTRASEELVLSRFTADDQGRATAVSAWWTAAQAVFTETLPTERTGPDDLVPALSRLKTPKDLLRAMGGELSSRAVNFSSDAVNLSAGSSPVRALEAAWDGLEAEERSRAGFGETSAEFEARSARLSRPASVDPARLGPDAFRRRKPWSATEAQALRQCRFKYFAQYGIGIRPPVVTTPVMREGEVWHKALEILMRQWFARPNSKLPALDAFLKSAQRAMDEALTQHPLVPERYYSRTARLDRIRRRWPRVVASEWKNLQDTRTLTPVLFEAGFGLVENGIPSEKGAFAVEVGGERLEFQGKIDRVDADPVTRRAMAADYKSGEGFKPAELKKGMRFQAVLYALALEKVWGYQPIGTEYVSLKNFKRGGLLRKDYFLEERPKSRLKSLMEPGDFDAFIQSELKALADDWIRYRSGDVAADSKSCQYCDFYPLCRYEKRREKP